MAIDFFNRIIEIGNFHKNKPAIIIGGDSYSYHDILKSSFLLAIQFIKYCNNNHTCIILSDKKIELYGGMLACFFSNSVYTPINIYAGVEKNKQILSMLESSFIFVGDIEPDILFNLLSVVSDKHILFSSKFLYESARLQARKNHLWYLGDHQNDDEDFYVNHDFFYQFNKKQDTAYLFFTSGSTGVPKAVPISYENLSVYISDMLSLFSFSESDRFIQLSDIAFDISLHEILICFSVGATLYVYDDHIELSVARFIVKNKITQCVFVPSSIPAIINQCQFYKCHLNSLKCVFVCGEPFPISFATALEQAAPESIIVNLYGPTEATVICSYHIFQKNNNYGSLLILPIGHPFPHTKFNIADQGELIISGDQVSSGYWFSSSKASEKFYFNMQSNAMSYCSGDYVSLHKNYGYLFHGRMDDQWQVKGYRVEKNEIESILRNTLNISEICVVPQCSEDKVVQQLIAFSTDKIDIFQHKTKLLAFLSEVAIPSCVIQLDEIPKLTNGKINYKYLTERVKHDKSLLCGA